MNCAPYGLHPVLCVFPCQPQVVAACRSPQGWLQKSHSWPPTARHRRLSAGIMPEIDNNRSNGTVASGAYDRR